MTYLLARRCIRTGDVALVKGTRSIRIATGESYSHVALFVWIQPDSLWVFEFTARSGFQSMPASQWFEQRAGQILYWGEAPQEVYEKCPLVIKAATSYRTKKPVKRWYGWLSFPTIWFSQVFNLSLPVWLKVCSTFVQEAWESTGYDEFERTADPGDIAEHCERLTRIS